MSQQWNSPSEAGEEDVQLPLGTGADPAPAEEYAGSRGTSRLHVNSSTVALFGAFAVAVVILYLLGLQNKPRPVSASDLAHQRQTDERFDDMLRKAEAGKLNDFVSGTKDLADRLRRYFMHKTVLLELPGNPFEKEEVRVAVAPTPGVVIKPVPTTDPVKEKLLRDTAQEFGGLKLQGIMLGTPPAALIKIGAKTRLVSAGEKFNFLRVVSITGDGVLLSNETGEYRLTVEKPDTDK